MKERMLNLIREFIKPDVFIPHPCNCFTCGINLTDKNKLYDKWLNEYVWKCPRTDIMITKQSMNFTSIVGCCDWANRTS